MGFCGRERLTIRLGPDLVVSAGGSRPRGITYCVDIANCAHGRAEGKGATVPALVDEDVHRALLMAAVELTDSHQDLTRQQTRNTVKLGSPRLSAEPLADKLLDTESADWVSEAYESFYGHLSAKSAPSAGSSNTAFFPSHSGIRSGKQASFRQVGVPAESFLERHDRILAQDSQAASTTAYADSLQTRAESFSSHASACSTSSSERASAAVGSASASWLRELTQSHQLSGCPSNIVGGFLDKVQPGSSTGPVSIDTQTTPQLGDAGVVKGEQQVSAVPQVACSGLGRVQPVVSAAQKPEVQSSSGLTLPLACIAAPEPRTLASQDILLTRDSSASVTPTAGVISGRGFMPCKPIKVTRKTGGLPDSCQWASVKICLKRAGSQPGQQQWPGLFS